MQETVDLVTFTEEILTGKLHFLFSVYSPLTMLTKFPSDIFDGLLIPLLFEFLNKSK